MGDDALRYAPSTDYNTAVGYQALQMSSSGTANNSGNSNSAMGVNALYSNTTGSYNLAMGRNALYSNTTGTSNSAMGVSALYSNTTGTYNSAMGVSALYSNTTGASNSAMGESALFSNTTGVNNSAMGMHALYYNTSATSTVAVGYEAGKGAANYNNQGGVYVGYQAGELAQTGSNYNTFLGYQAGYSNTTGAYNIALGQNVDAPSVTDSQQLNIGNLLYGTGIYNGSVVSGNAFAGGKLGVGTTTPFAKLSIGGDSNGTYPLFAVSTSTLPATSTAFVIDSQGRVGVGTSTPYAELSVAGLTASGYYNADSTTATSTFAGGFTAGNNAALVINRAAAANSLYINPSGNVGIGTKNPSTNLHATDGTVSSVGWSGNKPVVLIENDGSASSYYSFGILNNGGPVLAVTNSGNIGIGETAPGSKLSVSGGGTFGSGYDITAAPTNGLLVEGSVGIGTTSPAAKLSVEQGSATTLGMYLAGYANATADLFRISTSTLTATSTAIIVDSTGSMGFSTTSPFRGRIAVVTGSDNGGGVVVSSSDNTAWRDINMDSSGSLHFYGGDAGTLNNPIITAAGAFTDAPSFSFLKQDRSVLSRDELFEILDDTNIEKYRIKSEVAALGESADTHIGIILDEAHPLLSDRDENGDIIGYSPIRTAAAAFRGVQLLSGAIDIRNATTSFASIFIDSEGRVGIGTTSPSYKLQVAGDVAAESFVNISTRGAKRDIEYVAEGEGATVVERLRGLGVARYRYNDEAADAPLRLGLIAEESPLEVLSADGKGVDLYKLATK